MFSALSNCFDATAPINFSFLCRKKVAALASREQMCINPQVTNMANNAAKNRVCRIKVKTRSCAFYQRFEETKESAMAATPCADIEEMINYGNRHRVCPYYLSKNSEKSAEIMFLPYNYVFDPSIRRTMKLDLENTVIILDEGNEFAHNYLYNKIQIRCSKCFRYFVSSDIV